MVKQNLEHLSKDELQDIFCEFYNEIDKNFSDNRHSRIDKTIVIMDMFSNYLYSSRKVLKKLITNNHLNT